MSALTIPPATTTDDDLAVLAAEINVAHAAFERASKRAIMSAHHAGALLLEAKGKVEHGQWLPWVKVHFDGSNRTAARYMRLARRYPDSTRLANLSLTQALDTMATPRRRPSRPRPPAEAKTQDPDLGPNSTDLDPELAARKLRSARRKARALYAPIASVVGAVAYDLPKYHAHLDAIASVVPREQYDWWVADLKEAQEGLRAFVSALESAAKGASSPQEATAT